jgi:predicted  nucleic acid-binding Zn-ribbon protein
MANETQQVLIEFITDTSGLSPAVDQLAKIGTVEKDVAEQFKKTNAEIQKQQSVIGGSSAAVNAAMVNAKKTIADVSKSVNTLSQDFTQGFEQGMVEALNEAGVSLDEFNEAMKKTGQTTEGLTGQTEDLGDRIAGIKDRLAAVKKDNSFAGLQKQISDAKSRVLETATALERLRRGGGSGTEGFTKLNAQLKEQQGLLQKLEGEYDAVINSASGFQTITADIETLKQQLAQVTQQLQQMKLAGLDATDPERYAALVAEAGNLKDALGDVAQEIKNAAANSQSLEGLLGLAQGIAGGFALAQGAVALFGKDSEELQEVLLRVNAAMAILQGLQSITAITQQESAAAKLLDVAATNAQTAATTAYNIVVGTSTGLMKAFRIALASTGIGLLIIGVVALVAALQSQKKATIDLNKEIDKNTDKIEDNLDAINKLTDRELANAQLRNALETEQSQIRQDALLAQRRAIEEGIKLLEAQRQQVTRTLGAQSDEYKKVTDAIKANRKELRELDQRQTIEAIAAEAARVKQILESQVATTENAILLAKEGSAAQLALQKKLVTDKQALELGTQQLTEEQRQLIITQSNKDQLELQLAFNKRRLDVDIAAIETRLSTVIQGTNAELQLRRELLQKQTQSELSTIKLSEEERQQIRANSINEQLKLEVEFAAAQAAIARENRETIHRDLIQAAITRNATELALLKDNDEERLRLQLVNIELAASEERRAAGANQLELNRINAQAEAAKLELRKQFAQAAVEYEIRLETAKNARLVRGLQDQATNERSTFQQRAQAIIELTRIEADGIDKRKQALRDQYKQGLISQKEYNLAYAELEDQRVAVTDEAEKRIAELTRARSIAQIQTTIDVATQIVGVLDSLFQAQSDKEQQRIEEQRARIDDLRESGAITEKEAARRRKQLEQEEKQAQLRAAQRDKQIAVFRALLAIPSAFLQGLAQGGPILGAIYAAVAAAQAAIVIAKPVPKFGKGKKNNYEGFAEVGETGAELIESNGQMYIAPKRTIMWVGARDKVYNPKETARMLEKNSLRAGRLPAGMGVQVAAGASIDLEKLGEVIARKSQAVNLNIDGYKQFIQRGNSFDTYLNNRRGF